MKYVVTRSRTSDYPAPIKLVKGDIVKTKEHSDDTPWKDWIMCERNGISGWVPIQYLDTLDNEEAIVRQDYDATELCVAENDVLVAEIAMNGWVWAKKELSASEYGWVPLENIRKID